MEQRIIYNYQLFKVLNDLNDFIEFNPGQFPGFGIELYNSARNCAICQSCERLEILKDTNLVNCFIDANMCIEELEELYDICSKLSNKVCGILCNDEVKKNRLDSTLIIRLSNNLDILLSNIISAKMPLMFGVNGKYNTMPFNLFCFELSKVVKNTKLYSNDFFRGLLEDYVADLQKLFNTRNELIECLKYITKVNLEKSDYARYIFNCEGWKMNVYKEYNTKQIYDIFLFLFGKQKIGSYASFNRGANEIIAH